jgi:RNA polymerase sigma-70 factor (ECF subfamily)
MPDFNRDELGEIYQKYAPAIHQRCIKYLRSPEDAKDATHDIFVKLIKKWDSIHKKDSVLYWLQRTTTHHCISQVRKKRAVPAQVKLESHDWPDKSLEDIITARDLIRNLMKPWQKKTREIVMYVYVDGYKQDDISEITGLAPSTIRKHLTRFRKRSKKLYRKIMGEDNG